jgi:hypothetical protein
MPVPNFVRPLGVSRDRRLPTPQGTPQQGHLVAPFIVRTRSNGPRWRVSAVCPPDWRASIEACGGGFFHSPAGLRLATSTGEPRFFEYAIADEPPSAVAIGAVRQCRFSVRPRHIEFATWPALRQHARWPEAIADLRGTLREMDIAEAVIGSFDADGETAEALDGLTTTRSEYRVRLDDDAEGLSARCSSSHRRRIRLGERSGWHLRFLSGDAARDAIAKVQGLASARAAHRGDGFHVVAPCSDAWAAGHFDDAWGACTIGAFEGEHLLSAAVIGWANGRAFYVIGGSTERGYELGAATWMHWRAMNLFRDAGGTWYNLGGVAEGTEGSDDRAAGLHRFKAGFGAERSSRFGVSWAIAPGHIRSHTAARWLARKATA